MKNDERNPKPECRKTLSGVFAGFVIRILSFLRISSFVIRICEEWFMESLHSLLRKPWNHEPTPNPSQEGNGQDADERLLPSWEGSGVGRFMERRNEIMGNVAITAICVCKRPGCDPSLQPI